MAKKSKPEGKKYSYMDTYGDLVTLLLCFFVLLFAMSTVEEVKYNAFVDALTDRFGPQPINLSQVPETAPADSSDFSDQPTPELEAEFDALAEKIEEFIVENGLEGDVTVQVGASGAVYIRLTNNLLFAGNSYALRAEGLPFLNFLADCFLELENQIFKINCLGHTAYIEGSGEDDWILSSSRSGNVASFFEKQRGFSGTKLETTGFGRYFPIADNNTADGIAKNRRVDLVVIGNDPEKLTQALVETAGVYFPEDDTSFFGGTPDELPANQLQNTSPLGSGRDSVVDLTPDEIQEMLDAASAVDATANPQQTPDADPAE